MKILYSLFSFPLILILVLSACAAYIPMPTPYLDLLLTYPPRLLLMVASLVLLVFSAFNRRWIQGMILFCLLQVFLYQLHWNFSRPEATGKEWTALSFNIHNQKSSLGELEQFCKKEKVDLLLLQEVAADERIHYTNSLQDYAFFWPDSSVEFEHHYRWSFSQLIGVRKELLKNQQIQIQTAISDYRSFAIYLSLGGRSLWLTNIHATKAFYIRGGFKNIIQNAQKKADWHLSEYSLLKDWVQEHRGEPLILAGDFNAPIFARGIRQLHLQDAHEQAGLGVHLSIPRQFPLWAIDHVLANDGIEFTHYASLDLGFSDHRAQLFKFQFTGEDRG